MHEFNQEVRKGNYLICLMLM